MPDKHESEPEQFAGATVKWAPEASEDTRASIRARMNDTVTRPTKPTKPRRAVSHSRSRALAEQRGRRNIASPDVVPCDARSQMVVRIYYRSQGGDLLYAETPPLSPAEASSLRNSYGVHAPTDAYAVQWFSTTKPEAPYAGARRADLPSQRMESVQILTTSGEESTSQSEILTPPVHPAPVVGERAARDNSLFRDASQRRAERARRWLASCTLMRSA